MDVIFQPLSLFASTMGLALTGMIAAAIVVVWDWRAALIGLFIVQLSVATVSVLVENVPAQWALIQTAVIGLSCMILALSAYRAQSSPSLYQSGTWLLRAAALVLAFVGWRFIVDRINLPVIHPLEIRLFVWLALCSAIMLGMGDSPLFNAVALLLWCLAVQGFISVLLAIPALVAIIGILEILVALACSYLILAEQLPAVKQAPVLTDMTFPESSIVHQPGGEHGATNDPGATPHGGPSQLSVQGSFRQARVSNPAPDPSVQSESSHTTTSLQSPDKPLGRNALLRRRQ